MLRTWTTTGREMFPGYRSTCAIGPTAMERRFRIGLQSFDAAVWNLFLRSGIKGGSAEAVAIMDGLRGWRGREWS